MYIRMHRSFHLVLGGLGWQMWVSWGLLSCVRMTASIIGVNRQVGTCKTGSWHEYVLYVDCHFTWFLFWREKITTHFWRFSHREYL